MLYARQDLVCLLKTFFGTGAFDRASALQGWIRRLQPRQRVLSVREHIPVPVS